MIPTEILIVSDLHLGSWHSHPKTFLKVVDEWDFKELIYDWDLYDSAEPVPANQLPVIEYVRKNCHRSILVNGNHDPDEENATKVPGLGTVKEYLFEVGGRKFCAIHGHRWDKMCFVFSEPWVDMAFLKIVKLLRLVRFSWFDLDTWLARIHQAFCETLAKKALKHAKKRGVDVIICGHTHRPEYREHNGITYINCGSFMEKTCSYVTIDHDGTVTLHEILSID